MLIYKGECSKSDDSFDKGFASGYDSGYADGEEAGYADGEEAGRTEILKELEEDSKIIQVSHFNVKPLENNHINLELHLDLHHFLKKNEFGKKVEIEFYKTIFDKIFYIR